MRMSLMLGVILTVVGCTSMSMTPSAQSGSMPKDGELAFPADYASYPTFLTGIQKPDAVRDIYINETGVAAHAGESFPNGTILVMAIFGAKKDSQGQLEKDPQGKLVKGELAKIYVMQKEQGWGKGAPAGLQNGDWIYSAFTPSGERLKVDYAKCRGCHLPLGEAKDFVHRYDEYFETRSHHSH